MNSEKLDAYRRHRQEHDEKFLRMIRNPLYFRLFLLKNLPAAFIAGCRVKEVNAHTCSITVPYRWLTQNPFRSTYFAVLSMAAEMSSGVLALMMTYNARPSVSMLVTHLEADFLKKATGLTTFTCSDGKAMNETVEQAILTGEAKTYTATATGRSETGEVEAIFKIEWSFKARL
ncbi:MAG: DUF4442 domain-containing protein [Chitinophagales bacterium]|nr:DUF4442 domain-containing protein [Chitinophagales bacterium]MDW8419158.1 DUF4442 domain-containing protein [Chitinophagales bacterium]